MGMAIRRQHKVKLITPLFGPYVFIKFDRERDPWGKLRAYDARDGVGIKGFVDIQKNNNIPVRIADLVIQRLKQAVDAGYFGLTPIPIDTKVEIMEGPFAGLIGAIKSTSKHRRAKVLLKMLGAIDIDPCFLRKI